MFKTIEDFQKFSKGQFDAATQSATAFSAGLQQMVTEAADFSKKSFETSSAAMQTLMSSRSIETVMQVQMDFAKSAYESAIAESTKFGGMMSATAQNAFKPLEGAFAQTQQAARTETAL